MTATTLFEDRPAALSTTLQRYIFSHYVYSGVAVAAGVLLVALATYALFGIEAAAAASTGAMAVSIADVPRPAYVKRLQLPAALLLATLTTLLIGLTASSGAAQLAVILAISFSAAMLTAYGKESLPVSMAVMVMMAIALGTPMLDARSALTHSTIFAAGGSVYLAYGLATATWLRFRTKQQALAEFLHELAVYLKIKANFYELGVDLDASYRELISQQSRMTERLQAARDLVFRALRTPADGQLACTLIATLDVYEHMLANQTDYDLLRRRFGGADVLVFLRDLSLKCAAGLEQISFAVLRGREPRSAVNYRAELYAIRHELDRFQANPATPPDELQAQAELNEIHDTIRRGIEQIEHLVVVARTPVEPGQVAGGLDLTPFISRLSLSPRLLLGHFRRDSPILRFALRITSAMGCGYLLAAILPYAAHSQWILLTLAVIMRPNFSLTKQRRTDRVVGNAVGCVLTAGLLYLGPGTAVLYGGIFVALAVAHTCAPIKYRYTAAAACVMALLQLHLLNPTAQFAITERLIDTLVGAALAYGFSFMLPNWEAQDFPKLVASLLQASAAYTRSTLAWPQQDFEFRLARKRFNDAIGALSTALGRMLQEPGSRHLTSQELNAFVTLNYLLAAHLAALRILLQAGARDLDPQQAGRLIDAARDAIQVDLSDASALFAPSAPPPPPVEPSADEPALALRTPAAVAAAATDWSAVTALDQRLRRIRDDVRGIRRLSTSIRLAW